MIQSGIFEAVKGSGAVEEVLFKYEEAGAFGELALMYNCPRAATVRVRDPGRICFFQVLEGPRLKDGQTSWMTLYRDKQPECYLPEATTDPEGLEHFGKSGGS